VSGYAIIPDVLKTNFDNEIQNSEEMNMFIDITFHTNVSRCLVISTNDVDITK
jgi:hypothetical protein